MTGPPLLTRRPLVDDLNTKDFERIADVLKREAGIALSVAKLPLVQSRLLRRLRALCLADYSSYCDIIESDDAETERSEMVSALTTNVTGFFREKHHFEFLKQHRIQELVTRLKRGYPVRIWSAGCSSGEEPYSLALTFLNALPDIGKRDFKILATDIDQSILSVAVKGSYPEDTLNGIQATQRAKFFVPDTAFSGHFRVSDAMRDLVVFRRLNLIDPWPFSRAFDLIMCRNVVIYFGDETKADVWSRMVQHLRPEGYLFTGHSERLSGRAAHEMELVATTTYKPIPKPNIFGRAV